MRKWAGPGASQWGAAIARVSTLTINVDCLDIASRDFQIVGKFLFQTVWKAGIPQQVYNYSPTLLTR